MKTPIRVTLLVLALSAAGAVGTQSFAQINAEHAKVVPDEAAAIALAEKASLPLIGGEDKLSIARPFRATGHGDIWLVISQPVPDPMEPSAGKRAIVVQLSAATGEILDIDTAR